MNTESIHITAREMRCTLSQWLELGPALSRSGLIDKVVIADKGPECRGMGWNVRTWCWRESDRDGPWNLPKGITDRLRGLPYLERQDAITALSAAAMLWALDQCT